MIYTLSRFGSALVLTDDNNKRTSFKSFEVLCEYIKRNSLQASIRGLEILPDFYQQMIGVTLSIEIALLSSGLTNEKIIQ